MLLSPRIKIHDLARLCRRLATALEAGIDVRTVWSREAERARGRAARTRFRAVSEAVGRGESIREALARSGDFFPLLFRELADMGDQTGHLDEAFARLGEHYEEQLKRRRIFLAVITWPLVQLALAVAIVGFLIWIMGVINPSGDHPIDPLGLGLLGTRGLLIYVAFLATVGVLLAVIVQAVRRGLVWTRPIQRAATRLPLLGRALEAVALGRLTWSLHLTLDAGMEIRRAVRLSLRSTRNARFIDTTGPIEAAITSGDPLYETFLRTGVYPNHFLDALQVGEQSGKLVESMGLLSRQYRDQAQNGLNILAVVAGFAVWMIVAGIIIALIFRLFFFYVNTLWDFMP